MFKRLYILMILLALASGLSAQLSIVDKALLHVNGKEYGEGKELIDRAIQDSTFASFAKTWYIRGYIYKELFKDNPDLEEASSFRLEAISSFRQALELDAEKQDYSANIRQILQYLAQTLYNDAAESLEGQRSATAVRHYTLFKELMKIVDPQSDFRARDIQFYLVLASSYSKQYEEQDPKDPELQKLIHEAYSKVLELDSNNLSANYNLGVFYYNQAVHIIDTMDYGAPIDKLLETQERCIDLFLKALPYMKKAYALNPMRRETLISLSGIYFSLNDIEKSKAYEEELEKIDANSPPQDPSRPDGDKPTPPEDGGGDGGDGDNR